MTAADLTELNTQLNAVLTNIASYQATLITQTAALAAAIASANALLDAGRAVSGLADKLTILGVNDTTSFTTMTLPDGSVWDKVLVETTAEGLGGTILRNPVNGGFAYIGLLTAADNTIQSTTQALVTTETNLRVAYATKQAITDAWAALA